MNIVYLIYEDAKIKVPFYDYDEKIFSRLKNVKRGFWDAAYRQFVLTDKAAANFPSLFADLPYVEIGKTPHTPFAVEGFFHRRWERNSAGLAEPAPPVEQEAAKEQPACALFSQDWAGKLEVELHARKYSLKTVRAYLYYNRDCCQRLQKTPETMMSGDISRYIACLNETLELSASSMNLAISALKFFYHQIAERHIVNEQHRPQQDKKLPQVLSGAEILALLQALDNVKHRLLLTVAYSSGLRVSEVVALKLSDIDFERQSLLIRSGKGRKDRYSMLSDKAAALMKDYCRNFRITDWLFPGLPAAEHLSVRSAQRVFEQALAKAGIAKRVSIHSLRHSFATHLMENGTAIRYIQELLGHTSVRTTERYTHVARRSVLKIVSPLDILQESRQTNDIP